MSENRDVRQRAFYYTRVYADPKDKDTVYAPNVMFMKSTDAGKTWKMLMVPHGDNHDMWIDPTNPKRFIVGNDGAATVTTDGGQTWTPLTQPTAQFYHVELTGDVPYHVCGAQQDNTTACVSSAAASGFAAIAGGVDTVFYSVGGGESGYIANDPKNPDIFYAGSYSGDMTRFDRKTGQLQRINPYPENPMGYASKDRTERFQWTFPIVFSPTDPTVLYAGSQHLWKTTNGGQTWTKISPDLTRHDPKTMEDSGGPITQRRDGRRDLRDDLHDRAVAEGRQPDLDRLRRRLRADHARRAARPGRTSRRRTCRNSRASASSKRRRSGRARRTSPPTAISTTTSRPTSTGPTTTARRGRRSSTASRRATSRAPSARIRRARSSSTSAPSTASTSRSTTARTGSRSGRTCPTCRCTTSRSRRAIS